jgi:hypothetical protein
MKTLLRYGFFGWILWVTSAFSAPENPKFYLTVICDEPAARTRLNQSLLDSFKSQSPNAEITSDLSQATYGLWVMAERSKQNKKNPDGYSLAILHTNSGVPRELGALLNKIPVPKENDDDGHRASALKLMPGLVGVAPPLVSINVANLESLSREEAKLFSQKTVKLFLDRAQPASSLR